MNAKPMRRKSMLESILNLFLIVTYYFLPLETISERNFTLNDTRSSRNANLFNLNVKLWNHDAKSWSLSVRLFKTRSKNRDAVSTNLFKF